MTKTKNGTARRANGKRAKPSAPSAPSTRETKRLTAQARNEIQRLKCLGALLAKARRSKGLSQTVVAAAISRTPGAVCDYETGRREPPALVLLDLAHAVGLRVGRLAEIQAA